MVYVYRLQEGHDDESYLSADITHTEKYSQAEFDSMCKESIEEVKEIKDFIDCGDVSIVMCKRYGFEVVNPILVHNTDR